MPERACCAECFSDPGLRQNIIPRVSTAQGDCNYCGTTSVAVVPPIELRPYFELVIGTYEVSDAGDPLVHLLREDWALFEHPAMDDAHAKELLADVLDDGDLVRRSFARTSEFTSDSLTRWDDLRDEMMHRNRWFLDEPIDLDRLRELLDHLIAPGADLAITWYRARLQDEDEPFDVASMGAPPHRKAGHGRANPAGIPYLYVGSTPETAIAEIRPHTGELACVADFAVPAIRAVDLRRPRASVSPFILSDAGEVSQLRADIPLLERLGEELTRPVLPRGAAFEYIPSQYLCEFIKKSGFDGVVYRSSVSPGINLALFDPAIATPGTVSVYDVAQVSVRVAAR